MRKWLWLLWSIFAVAKAQAMVNINTASVAVLQNLPHIGAVKAKAIDEYRRAHGSFKRKEDLIKVKGIGPKTYEKLKHEISVVDAIEPKANTTKSPLDYRAAKPITQRR